MSLRNIIKPYPSPIITGRGIDLDFPMLAGCLALLGLGLDHDRLGVDRSGGRAVGQSAVLHDSPPDLCGRWVWARASSP